MTQQMTEGGGRGEDAHREELTGGDVAGRIDWVRQRGENVR